MMLDSMPRRMFNEWFIWLGMKNKKPEKENIKNTDAKMMVALSEINAKAKAK